ncbi:MAG: ABC transporter ATP-binding protein [Actinobacteria bacterium]|nr:ABC transporter ATP-binding protein [Actinomycetota bacterium]
MTKPVLLVRALRVELDSGLPIVEDLDLDLRGGEVVGIVGESGSGKTTMALALLGFTRRGVAIRSGTVEVEGSALTEGGERSVRSLRGRLVSYVAQDPGAALNPSLRVGDLVGDMLRAHDAGGKAEGKVMAALRGVNLPAEQEFLRRFPHQLSGGQQQRVAIATALVCGAKLVVLDEPTTGLDVVTQARILNEIQRLRSEQNVAIVYVSHDLAVVSSIADRVAVMYAGRIVEEGPTAELVARPRHPYTRGLLSSVPDPVRPRRIQSIPGVSVGVGDRPPGCAFAPRCLQRTEPRALMEAPPFEQIDTHHRVRCFEWHRTPSLEWEAPLITKSSAPGVDLLEVDSLTAGYGSRLAPLEAVRNVSFSVAPGECLAIVGESGSGKSTLARCIVGLHPQRAGRVLLEGAVLAPGAARRTREARRRIQIVFQNPNESLNPRHRVGNAIARPASILRKLSAQDADEEAARLLGMVRLSLGLRDRFPGELSGGERQRVAIARALSAKPDLIICDEITSALDVSVQAAVLELLSELRAELGLALVFITHDLGVVASIADRMLVLESGAIREQGGVAAVLSDPQDDYTRRLVAAAPRLMTSPALPHLSEVE